MDPIFSDRGINNLVNIAPGVVVEQDVLGIVEWIRDYDERLDILCLDPSDLNCSPSDPPYIIVEHCSDGQIRIIMRCWTLDERVKTAIIAADTQRTDVLAAMDKQNQRAREAQERQFQDSLVEAHDLALHIFRNPKTTYRFRNIDGELLTLEDDKGVVKRATDRDN
jgi:hypothetical protein